MTFTKLYEFQEEDVEKALEQTAILNGSDMGTGKTHTAIETAIRWRQQVLEETGLFLPILVVAPINTFESWEQKLDEQAPHLTHTTIDRKNRDWFIADIYNLKYDVYIMHWAAVRLIQPQLEADGIHFSVVIGDEIHYISNRDSQMARSFKKLKTFRKYAASGTASGSVPWNLWSTLNWLYPTYFNDYWKFVFKYAVSEGEQDAEGNGSYRKFVGVKNTAVLHHIMEPWYIKHLKKTKCCDNHPEGVMPYLPDKNYEKLYVDLNDEQRRIYNEMFAKMVAWVGEQRDTPMIAKLAVTKLARLMQITLATPVVTTKEVWKVREGVRERELQEEVNLILPSSKMDAAFEIISGNEDSIIVFTSSKKGAYLFSKYLSERNVSCEVLSGDTPKDQRATMQRRFRNGEFRIFIAVIAAAAEGMDGLQDVCNTAIFLNRSLSAYKNIQAEDRLHRGGQHNNVTIVDIIARDTIDGERLEKLDGTWASIKAILGLE